MHYIFIAKIWKEAHVQVDADTIEEAQQIAEKKIEKHVEANDYKSWTPAKVVIMKDRNEYPTLRVPWKKGK